MRPLKEPSPGKKSSDSQAAIRQLQRRPAPDQTAGAAGDQPWIRLILEGGNQTIAAASNAAVLFDTVKSANAGSAFGTASVGGGTDNAVTILEDGIYVATWRLWMNSINTNLGFMTELSGVDYDTLLYYEFFHPPILSGLSANGSFVFKSGPDYGSEPPEIYLVVRNPTGANASVVVKADFATGSYLDVQKIGESVVGDIDGM